ncbi:MAG: type II toxin-antitoxin system HipA family toxin [Burkholderiaceae bacterium]
MNGERVGRWSAGGGDAWFAYDEAWCANPLARPLSLSLPLVADSREIRGPRVHAFFDNLLPDSAAIRRRLALREGVRDDAFALLEAIGRDCVGAVQILPEDAGPPDVRRIDGEAMSDADIALWLDATATGAVPANAVAGGLRFSLAGAQEKTALLRHDGTWMQPLGATPTTHILKLPMGEVGAARADFSTSVENEWLCARIVEAYGLPVAGSSLARFGRHRVLVVERFDRRLIENGWYARLPQEDFCQVTGIPADLKYENAGGPGIDAILDKLRGSLDARADRQRFLTAQLLFWMLAAPDGHAKNFSIHLLAGGAFRMTPLYDVLSAWPVIGRGSRKFALQDVGLAMALRAKNAHYRIEDIQRRHWNIVARRNAMGHDFEEAIESVIQATPGVIDRVARMLPPGFPSSVADPIFAGLQRQAKRLGRQQA